ncbi:tetratricopeptide repeat protein [Tropicibacter sp. Alg240-R139]|uniref:tetratricopeptide repeat protein n=1 Tax=Tropicibacter sp. Alg240-R139 TaxID=2305991 RepID=UPI001967D84E|nr:tetratricopeptide repeat protein [Tropicibacter sp. Alg240-R139]
MFKDHYENDLTTGSDKARDHYDQGVASFLAATYDASRHFANSIEADPGFALGHVGLARAQMMAGDMASAKTSIAAAKSHIDGATARERAHLNTFDLLFQGNPAGCRAAVKAHVLDHPRDAMVAQLCTSVFGLIGFSGEVGREADLLAFTTALVPYYGEDWWMMGIHAVSLCETGRLDDAQALMERSLALNSRNANAAHFKGHTLYEMGEAEAGLAYLKDWIKGYDNRGLLHGHLSWHIALHSLLVGDIDDMWALVDTGVGPGGSQGLPLNTLTDTAAILHRAELVGVAVPPERWVEMSDYAAQYFPETGQSFADMHAALAHAMAGNGDRLAYIVDTANGFAGDLVRPVAQAWGAIARQDWQGAVDHLIPALAQTERFGGSRAQRDLIELTYVNALMKLGRTQEAQHTLDLRRPVLASHPGFKNGICMSVDLTTLKGE